MSFLLCRPPLSLRGDGGGESHKVTPENRERLSFTGPYEGPAVPAIDKAHQTSCITHSPFHLRSCRKVGGHRSSPIG